MSYEKIDRTHPEVGRIPGGGIAVRSLANAVPGPTTVTMLAQQVVSLASRLRDQTDDIRVRIVSPGGANPGSPPFAETNHLRELLEQAITMLEEANQYIGTAHDAL